MPLQSSKVDDCAFEDALFHAMAVVQCHLPLRQADEENRVFFKNTPANEHRYIAGWKMSTCLIVLNKERFFGILMGNVIHVRFREDNGRKKLETKISKI